MKTPKVDTSGTERAQLAVAEAQKAATNLAKNFGTDLKNENLTTVTPGAGADTMGIGPDNKRRRPQAGGLASSLGINVGP